MKIALLLTSSIMIDADRIGVSARMLAHQLMARPGVVADVLCIPFSGRTLPGWLNDVERLAQVDFGGYDALICLTPDSAFANHRVQVLYPHAALPVMQSSRSSFSFVNELYQGRVLASLEAFVSEYKELLEAGHSQAAGVCSASIKSHFYRIAVCRRGLARVGAPSTAIAQSLVRLGAAQVESVWFEGDSRPDAPARGERPISTLVAVGASTQLALAAALVREVRKTQPSVRVCCHAATSFRKDLESLLPAGTLILTGNFSERIELFGLCSTIVDLDSAECATDARSASAAGARLVCVAGSAWADVQGTTVVDQRGDIAGAIISGDVGYQANPVDPISIDWLLPSLSHRRPAVARKRPRILSASTYPVWPIRSGGQARVYHLFRELARYADIELLTLSESAGETQSYRLPAELTEHRVAMTAAHHAAEAKLRARAEFDQLGDIAFPRLNAHTPEYRSKLRELGAGADLLVASHPYGIAPILDDLARPFVHDSHNVEFLLKREMMPGNAVSDTLIRELTGLELSLVRRAAAVSACSLQDVHHLQKESGMPASHFVYAPNGVDVKSVRYTSPIERSRRKSYEGRPGCVGFFMGSWHAPNVAAVARIFDLAIQRPDLRFVIAGSVCEAPLARPPHNVTMLGTLDDAQKHAWLGLADFALNPIESGSGTNLKMLDYLAAGLPVVTTPTGCRDLQLSNGIHARICELDQFAVAIDEAVDPELGEALARAGRAHVEQHFDWHQIAAGIWSAWRAKGIV
jgi:glycosyltransferase involved in cell wall biosynthesis